MSGGLSGLPAAREDQSGLAPLPQGARGESDDALPPARDITTEDDFDTLLNESRIRTVFQPIVSLSDGTVFGYEALSRGPIGTHLESADSLFQAARSRHVTRQLERICRFKAIASASSLPPGCFLFLNISPGVLEERNAGLSRDVMDQHRLARERIVLEITEKEAINDFELFKRTLQHYQRQGFKVAIDDAGAGHNSLRAVTEVRPHFIKLDMALVRDIDRDRAKNALVSAIIMFARRIDARVLAEGIETVEELSSLIEIGVDYGQGYLLARPAAGFVEPKQEIAAYIRERSVASRTMPAPKRLAIGTITRRAPALPPSAYTSEVLEIFDRHPDLDSVVLTEFGAPVGLVSRTKLYERLSHQFGYSIYSKRPVRLVMDDSYLSVDAKDSIDDVARKVVHRRRTELYDEIVVLENDVYAGVVSVRDLLHTMTEFQASVSRHTNSLTGLPGRALVQQEIERRAASGRPFALLHVDINHFRAYNDRHGFGRGDEVIRALADCLVQSGRDLDGSHSFVGHIGGVNFVALCAEEHVEAVGQSVLAQFGRKIAALHVSRDLAVLSDEPTNGATEVTLALVGITANSTAAPSYAGLAGRAQRYKRMGRGGAQDSFVLDGRFIVGTAGNVTSFGRPTGR
jgi:diguanylate cyclase (GGDEF)-like protein